MKKKRKTGHNCSGKEDKKTAAGVYKMLFSWVLNSARDEEEFGILISDEQSSIGWKRSDHSRQKSLVQGQHAYKEDKQLFCDVYNILLQTILLSFKSLIFSFSPRALPTHNAGGWVLFIHSWQIFLIKELNKHDRRISARYTPL